MLCGALQLLKLRLLAGDDGVVVLGDLLSQGGAVGVRRIAAVGGDEVTRLLVELRALLLDRRGESMEFRLGICLHSAAFLRKRS